MLFRTHLAVALLIALILLFFNINLVFIIVFVIASLLADIDSPTSKIGKRFKFLNYLFTHRGFFHSLFALLIFTILLYFVNFLFAIAFFSGYFLHLLLDSFTKQGIFLFYPFSTKRSKGNIRVGSLLETIVFFVVLFLMVVLLVFYIKQRFFWKISIISI